MEIDLVFILMFSYVESEMEFREILEIDDIFSLIFNGGDSS